MNEVAKIFVEQFLLFLFAEVVYKFVCHNYYHNIIITLHHSFHILIKRISKYTKCIDIPVTIIL